MAKHGVRLAERCHDPRELRRRRVQLVGERANLRLAMREEFVQRRVEKANGGRNIYLSDGQVTLVIIPWTMSDFENTGISARGMDHIGFKVESIDKLKSDIDQAAERNFRLRPGNTVVGRGKEGNERLVMFKRTCPLGCHHLADLDGLLLDVVE